MGKQLREGLTQAKQQQPMRWDPNSMGSCRVDGMHFCIVALSGISVWGCMYALNQQGITAMSLNIQTLQTYVVSALRARTLGVMCLLCKRWKSDFVCWNSKTQGRCTTRQWFLGLRGTSQSNSGKACMSATLMEVFPAMV